MLVHGSCCRSLPSRIVFHHPTIAMIATVLGPIDRSSITGSCSPHEQLLQKLSPSDSKAAYGNPITLHNLADVRSSDAGRFAASNRLFSLDESVQELRSLADAGGGLVLECSTSREGRDPLGLVEISRRTGMRIVMAASWKGTQIPSEEPSAEVIGRELERQLLFGEHVDPTVAVASTSAAAATPGDRVQAGFIVVSLADSAPKGELSIDTARELEGAAWAQQATAAPLVVVCSHFVRLQCVQSALAIATAHWGDESAADKKVIVAGMHGGVSQPLDGQVAMLKRGAVLCFDCFGRVEWLPGPEYYPSDEESAVRIAELSRQGFADRMVISQGVLRRIHLSRLGGQGYAHALRTIPPRLQRLGVSADDIALMTRGNMLGLLDWYTPSPPREVPKDYLPCSWCKKRFEPVEGEYFHKFQFVYCGIRCLRAHRDTGFDAARVG